MRPWDAAAAAGGGRRMLGLLLLLLLLPPPSSTTFPLRSRPTESPDMIPPRVTVNLDEAPEERWLPSLQRFDQDTLRAILRNVIQHRIPEWFNVFMKEFVDHLQGSLLEPFVREIRGICNALNLSFVDGMLINMIYESSMLCTSILVQDANGHIYHGRNLDFVSGTGLRNITVDVQFIKNGQIAYTGTTFIGYVGLWTGQSPYKFTVTGNQRQKDQWQKNATETLFKTHYPPGWFIRKTLEEAKDYKDAVRRLSNQPLITNVYCIVGGINAWEGVVISRNRTDPVDFWLLNPKGEWFLVQINCDHWVKCPRTTEFRKIPASKAFNEAGPENINLYKLYEILSLCPILSDITVYTTVMSAANPDEYMTRVRTPSKLCV
ncbi:N-acylethanolamine-hydrolyzing acid amidase-like [Monodelphis domestica]|uniref:N-acylethanolamine-hydrolyzing acid amidase-like n=1 Tax=Monodelphis domestica TaxID=13616 RepID=UPI0024E25597|nr:N-acylethanolamine-hydrolyzing acid amidase-like [Monodelphis domestica]